MASRKEDKLFKQKMKYRAISKIAIIEKRILYDRDLTREQKLMETEKTNNIIYSILKGETLPRQGYEKAWNVLRNIRFNQCIEENGTRNEI